MGNMKRRRRKPVAKKWSANDPSAQAYYDVLLRFREWCVVRGVAFRVAAGEALEAAMKQGNG
jgi:hypothetical protein